MIDIGNHVWINNDVMILPGSKLSDDCIIMAKSLINNKFNINSTLIGGVPVNVVKYNMSWE